MISSIILTLIIFTLVIIILKKKENFYNTGCNFVPWGINVNDCINYCKNSDIRKFYDIGDECTELKCSNICRGCNNKDMCQWLDKFRNKSDSDEIGKIENMNRINLTANIEDNNLVLRWVKDNITFDNSYAIHFKEINTNINSLGIIETNQNVFSFSLDENDVSIPLLKKNTEYVFKVFSISKSGVDGYSNLLNYKT